jgi:ammonium transporter, Amt family
MTIAPGAMSDSLFALTLALLMLSPLVIAGIALINAGLGRSRSAAQALLGNLAIIAVTAIVFSILGSALAGSLPSGTGHTFTAAGKHWNWLGTGPFALQGLDAAPSRSQLGLVFELMAVAIVALIPWGSGADRLRLVAGCGVSAVLAGFVFPIAAHWIWGGGWLARLDADFGTGTRFIDAGGGGAVHVLGGLSALAVIWITGPRRGKFPKEGFSTAMPGHNAAYVLFGCMVSLVGFLGWNLAGAILWIDAAPATLSRIAVNTLLCGSMALAATFVVTQVRFGKPDASLCANGWMAGLVASSGSAAVVSPIASLFIGLVAGIATALLVEVLELALSVDDPSGAIAVHLVAGVWGIAAAGIFAPQGGQFLAQMVGIAALLGVFLPLVYFMFLLLNRFVPFRVESDGERIGMDLHELGGGAYPEFVIHRDELYR